ncbi:MAG: L-threonylcarbamoyladenylate synthase [Candidatus Staskawiczbacteria bacterium]|jgi:L-threonylcarbamoyladenylate synthase
MKIAKLEKKSISEAAEFLNKGGVIIFPTDTVYGFLADAGNKKAVAKIYKIKKRLKSKPLPVFVKDFKMAGELTEISKEQAKILKKKWPGKFTFVLERKKGIKSYDGAKTTIALRIPKYKFLNDLLKKINKPLAQTSVNISGEAPMAKIGEIIKQFEKQDILIIDAGNLKKSKPSKIIDLTKQALTRLR